MSRRQSEMGSPKSGPTPPLTSDQGTHTGHSTTYAVRHFIFNADEVPDCGVFAYRSPRPSTSAATKRMGAFARIGDFQAKRLGETQPR